jgi:hypothetical protein
MIQVFAQCEYTLKRFVNISRKVPTLNGRTIKQDVIF